MSHVVISEEYLNIMQSKAMAKAIVDDITKCKWKKGRKTIEKNS
jgi:hypothetical protein